MVWLGVCPTLNIIFSLLRIFIGGAILAYYMPETIPILLGAMVVLVISTVFTSRFHAKNGPLIGESRTERLKITEELIKGVRFIKSNVLEKLFLGKM